MATSTRATISATIAGTYSIPLNRDGIEIQPPTDLPSVIPVPFGLESEFPSATPTASITPFPSATTTGQPNSALSHSPNGDLAKILAPTLFGGFVVLLLVAFIFNRLTWRLRIRRLAFPMPTSFFSWFFPRVYCELHGRSLDAEGRCPVSNMPLRLEETTTTRPNVFRHWRSYFHWIPWVETQLSERDDSEDQDDTRTSLAAGATASIPDRQSERRTWLRGSSVPARRTDAAVADNLSLPHNGLGLPDLQVPQMSAPSGAPTPTVRRGKPSHLQATDSAAPPQALPHPINSRQSRPQAVNTDSSPSSSSLRANDRSPVQVQAGSRQPTPLAAIINALRQPGPAPVAEVDVTPISDDFKGAQKRK